MLSQFHPPPILRNHFTKLYSTNYLSGFILRIENKQVGVAVMLWTCVQEVLSSNLGWDVSYSDVFMVFSVLPGKSQDSTST
jgi:hypothetical protein